MAGIVTEFDLAMMRLALDQALNAATVGEVPVGAVIVREGQVIATGFNHPIGSADPTAHAEVRALRSASEQLGNYRLPDCDLYVTLEPCAMCAGAILQARIRRLFFGAPDPKTGVCGSVIDLMANHQLNHQTVVAGGLLAEECGHQLSSFFVERRQARKAGRRGEGAAPAAQADGKPSARTGADAGADENASENENENENARNENAVASDGIEVEFIDDPADS